MKKCRQSSQGVWSGSCKGAHHQRTCSGTSGRRRSPVKCGGKVIVIDGGFCKAYQKVTGIAGYTLIYNSYGLILCAHESFTSTEDAVSKESDIVSNRVAVHYTTKRRLVGDTDTGRALKERIGELIQLLDAYRRGIIKEKK